MILGIGTINLDYIIDCQHLPVPKESIICRDVTLMLGGKGANQIAAAARLGAENMFIAMTGANDPNNSILFRDLEWAGVNTGHICTTDGLSGSAFVMVEHSGQNSIIINPGANKALTPEIIRQKRACFEKAAICMTEFSVPMETCEYAIKLAKKLGRLTIVNPAPYAPISDSFYQNIDVITPNEIEAADFCGFQITDAKSASQACVFFHSKGVKNVVITMGSQGAFVSDGRDQMMIPCCKVSAIDTSGAGDSFNGGLAYAMDRNIDIFTAARFGNAVASLSVQKKGTARSMPSLDEVEKIFPL